MNQKHNASHNSISYYTRMLIISCTVAFVLLFSIWINKLANVSESNPTDSSYVTAPSAFVDTSHWSTFSNPHFALSFRYPPRWTITLEPNSVVAVVPPWAETRKGQFQSEEVPHKYYSFAIRIAPINTYTLIPATVTCADISDDFKSGLSEIPFKRLSLSTPTSHAVVLYEIGYDKYGIVAYAKVADYAYQISLGRYSTLQLTAQELEAYFGILKSLAVSSTPQAATMEDTIHCRL